MAPPLLIFLGAGASQPFGIPTMGEMVSKFAEQLTSRPPETDSSTHSTMKDLYDRIRTQQQKVYGYSDLESVFSVVDALASNNPYNTLGHTQSYLMSSYIPDMRARISNSQDQQAALALRKRMKAYVREACTLTQDMEEKADELYNELFHNIGKIHGHSNVGHANGKEYYYGNWRIYTTNYDLIMESYWRGILNLNDTFVDSLGLKVMQPELADSDAMKLVKLHGSVDWYRLKDKRIVKSENSRVKIGKTTVDGEQMVYPIQQKDLYLDPWLSLFSSLKHDLDRCDTWIVIGYRFNDQFIRNMFAEALEKREHRFILVNREADQIFSEKFGGNKSFMKPVVAHFGEHGMPMTVGAAMMRR